MVSKEFNPNIFNPNYIIRKGIYEAILDFASGAQGNLLDFGCGSKPYRPLFKNVESYIGLDYENEGHPHKNEQIDVFYDGSQIPFSDDTFDIVIATEVLEHVFDVEKTLSEINRVLKVGGCLFITCPFVWNEHEVPYDYARYTQYALKYLTEKNGFDTKSYQKKGNFITTICQLMILYWCNYIVPSKGLLSRIPFLNKAIRIPFVLVVNMIAIFCSKLLPQGQDLYLSNIILVSKAK